MAKAKATTAVAKAQADALTLLGGVATKQKPIEDFGGISNYGQFAHPQSPSYGAMITAAGGKVESGTFFLTADGRLTKVDPLTYVFAKTYFQYYAQYDSNGKQTAWELPDGTRKDNVWKETINAVVLVVVDPTTVVPARIRFKGPQCPAIKAAIKSFEAGETDKPDFAGRSKDHRLASQSGLPGFMWQLWTCDHEERTPKDTSNDQKPYELHSATPSATPALVLKAIRDANKSPEFAAQLASCLEEHGKTVSDVLAKVG